MASSDIVTFAAEWWPVIVVAVFALGLLPSAIWPPRRPWDREW